MECLASLLTGGSEVGRLWASRVGGDVFFAPASEVGSLLGVEDRVVRNVLSCYCRSDGEAVASLLDVAVLAGDEPLAELGPRLTDTHGELLQVSLEDITVTPALSSAVSKHRQAAKEAARVCGAWDPLSTPSPDDVAAVETAGLRLRRSLLSAARQLPRRVQECFPCVAPLSLFMFLLGKPKNLGLAPPQACLPLSRLSLARMQLTAGRTPRTPRTPRGKAELSQEEAAVLIQSLYKGAAVRKRYRFGAAGGQGRRSGSEGDEEEGGNDDDEDLDGLDGLDTVEGRGRPPQAAALYRQASPPPPPAAAASSPRDLVVHAASVTAFRRRRVPSPHANGGSRAAAADSVLALSSTSTLAAPAPQQQLQQHVSDARTPPSPPPPLALFSVEPGSPLPLASPPQLGGGAEDASQAAGGRQLKAVSPVQPGEERAPTRDWSPGPQGGRSLEERVRELLINGEKLREDLIQERLWSSSYHRTPMGNITNQQQQHQQQPLPGAPPSPQRSVLPETPHHPHPSFLGGSVCTPNANPHSLAVFSHYDSSRYPSYADGRTLTASHSDPFRPVPVCLRPPPSKHSTLADSIWREDEGRAGAARKPPLQLQTKPRLGEKAAAAAAAATAPEDDPLATPGRPLSSRRAASKGASVGRLNSSVGKDSGPSMRPAEPGKRTLAERPKRRRHNSTVSRASTFATSAITSSPSSDSLTDTSLQSLLSSTRSSSTRVSRHGRPATPAKPVQQPTRSGSKLAQLIAEKQKATQQQQPPAAPPKEPQRDYSHRGRPRPLTLLPDASEAAVGKGGISRIQSTYTLAPSGEKTASTCSSPPPPNTPPHASKKRHGAF